MSLDATTLEASALADAADKLRRALDRTRLYGLDHPEAATALNDAWSPLSEALSGGRPVSLKASLDGLSWRGHVLSQEDDDKEGLGRLLHREGISELTFQPSLTRDELARFLDVVRVNLALPEHEEETLESLLWQAQIEGVGFRAFDALMEAEAISGDAMRYLAARGSQGLDLLLEDDAAETDQDGPEQLGEDAIVRLVDRAEQHLVTEAGGAWDVEDNAWDTRLLAESDADAQAALRLRAQVALELPGDQVRRITSILLRIAELDRPELTADEALALADGAVDEIVRQQDAFALVQIVKTVDAARQRTQNDELARRFTAFVERATQPVLVARLLASAGPNADPAATAELVGMLDDLALRALIEWSFSPEADGEDAEKGRWLATALGDAAAERAHRWLSDPTVDPELLVPATQLLRGRDAPQDRQLRPTLLEHKAGRVLEITLHWYGETGMSPTEAKTLLELVTDRRPRIRAAACDALAAHTPDSASIWFQRRLKPQALGKESPEVARALCVGCARVMGNRSMRLLKLLFEQRIGMFAGKQASVTLEAAAFGLAALSSKEALRLLEEGATSWVGARAQACKAALASTGDKT